MARTQLTNSAGSRSHPITRAAMETAAESQSHQPSRSLLRSPSNQNDENEVRRQNPQSNGRIVIRWANDEFSASCFWQVASRCAKET